MRLFEATRDCEWLRDSLRPGLQALERPHSGLIQTQSPRSLQHSVDLEKAIKPHFPNIKHWDYAIGWKAGASDSCCFVEVHPARTESATDIIGKKKDIEAWLRQEAPAVIELSLATARRLRSPVWHWVGTAAISIHKGSRGSRQLADAGISAPVKVLRLS